MLRVISQSDVKSRANAPKKVYLFTPLTVGFTQNLCILGMNVLEYESLCKKSGEQWKVNPDVHPDDFIFRFILDHAPHNGNPESGVLYYFSDGAASAERLRTLLADVCGVRDRRFSLLEFASGYGCVTRHFKNVLPSADVTCSDIHAGAMEFVRAHLGVRTVQSASVPEGVAWPGVFDAVFALSFFSHMPKATFRRWFVKLAESVAPGGFLVFTTHGAVSKRLHIRNSALDSEGFFFLSSSEQKDLNPAEYGCAVALPSYVLGITKELEGISLKHFREGYWWDHQDLYIFEKAGAAAPDPGDPSAMQNLKTELFSKLSYLRWKLTH